MEQGRSKTGIAPACQTGTHGCPKDTRVSDKNTRMPSLLSQALDSEDGSPESSTSSQSTGGTGDVPEECRFLLYTHERKDTTTNIFDDDEWIRSLTEAQAITADIPEERVTHEQSEVEPKKVRPIQMGSFCEMSQGDS